MVAESTVRGQRPLVSIIVPSYNQGRFIRRTLDSILSQDYRPIEIIVIDGASTDETVSILREYSAAPELYWVSEPDRGVVDAVNKGFARARGEIGAIQSSDDFYLPGAITASVAVLQENPALAFVYGDIATIDAEGRELSRTQLAPYSLVGALTLETWIPQPSTFFRLSLAKSLGGWRESVPYAADTDLWFRMALDAPAVKMERLVAERSMHDAQRDRQGERIARDYGAMIASLMPQLRAHGLGNAARAGQLLIANKYVGGSELMRVFRLWNVVLLHPPTVRRYSYRDFLPGANWLRGQISTWARRLGIR